MSSMSNTLYFTFADNAISTFKKLLKHSYRELFQLSMTINCATRSLNASISTTNRTNFLVETVIETILDKTTEETGVLEHGVKVFLMFLLLLLTVQPHRTFNNQMLNQIC